MYITLYSVANEETQNQCDHRIYIRELWTKFGAPGQRFSNRDLGAHN